MATPAKKKKNRSKLGRGLSALVDQSAIDVVQVSPRETAVQTANTKRDPDWIGQDSADYGERVLEIDVTHVVPNPHQPRRVFSEESLEELARSITEHGLMQPIVVRQRAAGAGSVSGGVVYELIAGERRWRATCRTGQGAIRALVIQADDIQSAQLALIENIQREDLNPIERACGFVLLSERFAMTQDQIATKVGISRSSVANFVRLMELDDEIQSMIASGQLGAGHGKALLSCQDLGRRRELAKLACDEGWTVRLLEKASALANQHVTSGDEVVTVENGGDEQVSRIKAVLLDLEKRLGEQLSTKVHLKADRTGTRGSITIDFYDLDHFDGLMTKLGVGNSDDLGEER